MTRRFLLPMALTTALAACAGPHTPTVAVAPLAPNAGWRTDTGPTAPIDRAWWESFGDPVLVKLVDAALQNNVDIGIATARVREASAEVKAARASFFPTINAGVAGSTDRELSPFLTPAEQTSGEPQVSISYEVDLFGRIADTVSAARSGYLASQAARDAVRLAVASQVASSYVTLRALDARLEIARQTLAAREDSLRIARSRTLAGYSPRLELAQAEAEYQAAAQIVPQVELGIARQENSLRDLIGQTPGDVVRGSALEAIRRPTIPDGLPSGLLRRRPDIAQAEYQLAAADSLLAAARKRFLPQLTLTGSAGVAFSTLLGNPVTLWSVGGSALAPIFEGGRLRAQAESAAAGRDQAAFGYRRVALGAFREVEDALAAVRRNDEQVQILIKQRDALIVSVTLATNRYRAGYSPYLEQLDAQRQLLGAELALAQAESDAVTARISLYQAMGGGWSREAVIASAA